MRGFAGDPRLEPSTQTYYTCGTCTPVHVHAVIISILKISVAAITVRSHSNAGVGILMDMACSKIDLKRL